MQKKAPIIGVISNLGMIDEESYLRENRLDEVGTTIALGRRSTAEDILAVMEASDLLIFTGSTDNVLKNGRIDWESHLVRRSLTAFVHVLQTGRRDLLEKAALFFCFSAQLLSVALALHEELLFKGIRTKNMKDLEAALNALVRSPQWQIPMHQLKEYQSGIQQTDCGRFVLVSHGQAISQGVAAYLEQPSYRTVGNTRILESGTLVGSGWELHQSHADYNLALVSRLHPEIESIPAGTRHALIIHLNQFQNDHHTPRERRMDRAAA